MSRYRSSRPLPALVLALAAVLPSAASAAPLPSLDRVERMVVEDANDFRAQNGAKRLPTNDRLTAAAQRFADYMARTGNYGHEADGRTPGQRVKAQGYAYCRVSENIAYAFDSRGFSAPDLAGKFMEGWKKSPGHRRNLLDRDVAAIGVAVAVSERTGYFYAVQLFARGCP
jgi:uncharacterized protein YkwD